MGCPEWTLATLKRIYWLPRNGMDEQRLGLLGIGKRRQYGRHPACKHSLAGARWPHHEHAVASRRSDDHCAFGDVLVHNIREVETAGAVIGVRTIVTRPRCEQRQISYPGLQP